MSVEPFSAAVQPAVRGFVHRPEQGHGDALVLCHGAGSNANAPLLIALSEAVCGAGFVVLRCDLPYRQSKPFGPPMGTAELDQAGLKNAVLEMRKIAEGRIFIGGHSYGGRQSTMLCVREPDLVAGLLLMSYPLHPPRKPGQLRTQHFSNLRTPALFIHGTRDPFGSIEELSAALELIPARTKLIAADGQGHDLGFKGKAQSKELPGRILENFQEFFRD